jgi:hypothetical protein
MKRYILTFVLVLTSLSAFCQNTIKFLGIPIEGTKKEMIAKLQAKGYEYNSYSDELRGEFNGQNVVISVQTVNNRVWRLAIVDITGRDEADIKIRFNNLYEQFLNNAKYKLAGGMQLKESDDISYQMTVNKKRYDAYFTFIDESINGCVWYMIAEQFGRYKIAMFYENLDYAANGDDL